MATSTAPASTATTRFASDKSKCSEGSPSFCSHLRFSPMWSAIASNSSVVDAIMWLILILPYRPIGMRYMSSTYTPMATRQLPGGCGLGTRRRPVVRPLQLPTLACVSATLGASVRDVDVSAAGRHTHLAGGLPIVPGLGIEAGGAHPGCCGGLHSLQGYRHERLRGRMPVGIRALPTGCRGAGRGLNAGHPLYEIEAITQCRVAHPGVGKKSSEARGDRRLAITALLRLGFITQRTHASPRFPSDMGASGLFLRPFMIAGTDIAARSTEIPRGCSPPMSSTAARSICTDTG